MLCPAACRKFSLPVDVQMIRVDKGEHKQQAYLQINPLGKVCERLCAQLGLKTTLA
jgi:hypothetical protein